MRNLLGCKGVVLNNICSIEIPIVPNFTITTEVCTYYYVQDKNTKKDNKLTSKLG